MSPVVAKLMLAFSVAAFFASIGAIVNPHFRNLFLRDPRYLKKGTRITVASAWLSALWWAVIAIFLALDVFHIHSDRLENFLGPLAGCLLLTGIFVTYYEYRRWKRSN
jgi:drug/metabolite transporter (DMT)-like permease